ncbi:MAG: L,D-transpeptidase, partial [Verrucomicrobiota bacterium]
MAIGRILLIGSIALFSMIAITAVIKKSRARDEKVTSQIEKKPTPPVVVQQKTEVKSTKPLSLNGDLPCIDRIYQLFSKNPASQFPIVETISYSSSVSWLAGRPAWLNDYADYYQTSSSFILRSLGAKGEYSSQRRIVEGNRFNVFRRDKKVEFYLLVDISRCKMGFYYFDVGTNERVLLKTYSIGLGRLDTSKPSGSLTPLGKYLLGKRVATYQLE